MKRPFLDTIFSPIEMDIVDATTRLLDLLVDEFEDTYLSSYYAGMQYNQEDDTYEWTEETMDLNGRQDLLRRIDRDHGGRWSCDVNIAFGPAAVYPSLFFDPADGIEITVVVSTDPGVTEYVEGDDGVRVPFVLFLTQLAEAIDADWFMTGLEIDHWRRLSAVEISEKENLPPGAYIVGWKHGVINELELVNGLAVQAEDVYRTTTGYRFITFFPGV